MIALTLGAEWSQGPLLWGPDLLTGLAFFVLAAWLWTAERIAALLALGVGATWFLGSFLVPWALYWHRGPLIHLVLLIPLAQARSWRRRIVLGSAYAVSSVPVFWSDDVVAVIAGVAVALVAWLPRRLWWRGGHSADGPAYGGRALWFARWAALSLAASIVVAVALTLLLGANAGLPALLQYEAALVTIAVLMALGRRDVREAVLTDLVVDLEEGPSDSLTAALAWALGDPSVRVGYWSAEEGEYRDARGRTLPLPSDPDSGVTATEIRRDGERFALLVHEISLEGDPRLLAAISSATLLTATNTELRVTARARVDDVEASRRRLVVAADEELLLVARQLDADVAAPIRALANRIQDRRSTLSSPAAATFAAAYTQLLDVLDTLDATALGLPPKELENGLRSGLAALAARCPLPLTVDAPDERFTLAGTSPRSSSPPTTIAAIA